MREYIKVDYKFRDYKGYVVIDSAIKDESEIRDICIKDYLESNVEIIKNNKEKEGK